ncbi:zinc ribbon protein [Biostraticola tofi]|uniref:Zinc ribbon protein n=1 Tax=Biostraticola tofi TaxID=466109 RepID=A0A4R3YJJ2_9GAMM|nr:zinc ribbon protein [Biostraticola tofi]
MAEYNVFPTANAALGVGDRVLLCAVCLNPLQPEKGELICANCSRHYQPVALCPDCGKPLEVMTACGAIDYFCQLGHGLISRRRLVYGYQE